MKELYLCGQAGLSGILAWVAARLGALGPILGFLVLAMGIDYITGMLASKAEAIEHPTDPAYGWSSRRGTRGILKKVGYVGIVVAAMILDYLLVQLSGALGYPLPTHVVFGLLVTVWLLLNELLSIIENCGRMGAPVPPWLAKCVAVLKNKIDQEAEPKEEVPEDE